jgi:hypothetical protein
VELHHIVLIVHCGLDGIFCTTLNWFHSIFSRLHNLKKITCEEVFEKIVDYVIKSRSSLFVLSSEIEHRDEVEVETGRNTKRPSTNNDIIYYFIFKRVTKKKSEMNSFILLGSIKVSKVY